MNLDFPSISMIRLSSAPVGHLNHTPAWRATSVHHQNRPDEWTQPVRPLHQVDFAPKTLSCVFEESAAYILFPLPASPTTKFASHKQRKPRNNLCTYLPITSEILDVPLRRASATLAATVHNKSAIICSGIFARLLHCTVRRRDRSHPPLSTRALASGTSRVLLARSISFFQRQV